MMDINKHVISLDLAKRLKELKVNQNSLFYYFRQFQKDNYLLRHVDYNHYEEDIKIFKSHFPDNYSAFTVSELGNMLPTCVTTKENEPFNDFRIAISKFITVEDNIIINNYIINYECIVTSMEGETAFLRSRLTTSMYDPNLANAMARMLIFLIENKLINI